MPSDKQIAREIYESLRDKQIAREIYESLRDKQIAREIYESLRDKQIAREIYESLPDCAFCGALCPDHAAVLLERIAAALAAARQPEQGAQPLVMSERDFKAFKESIEGDDEPSEKLKALMQPTPAEGELISREAAEAKLCLVKYSSAYFTTQPLDKQWGDDWNDAPYEHNAGTPYAPHDEKDGRTWKIFEVKFDGDLETPADLASSGNSPYSVEMINKGAVAWLASSRWNDKKVSIAAGTTLADFLTLVRQAGGTVYLPTTLIALPAAPADEQRAFPNCDHQSIGHNDGECCAVCTLTAERDELREALQSLFCCECGQKFAEQSALETFDHACETHKRIRKLIGEK